MIAAVTIEDEVLYLSSYCTIDALRHRGKQEQHLRVQFSF